MMRSPIFPIRTLLAASSALSALSIGLSRIHYLVADQRSPYPHLVAYPNSSAMTELLEKMDYPIAARVSVECRDIDAVRLDQVGLAVISALNNIHHRQVLEFYIQECRLVGDVSTREAASDVYRRILDFRLHYSPGS